jgi:putative ABC transport system permease protein
MNRIVPPEKLLPWAPERGGEADRPVLRQRPGFATSTLLAIRLAWRQLRSEKARLASAIAGVLFACVLVFMQLGFRSALFESATNLIGAMRGDLFLMHPLTTASFRPEPLPRVRAQQALALPEVERAVPVYLAQASWRNPVDGSRRAVQLIGVDSAAGVLEFPGLGPELVAALQRADAVAFDTRSRPEFGPVGRLLAERGSPIEAEIGGRRVDVVGLIEIGPSFGADGNVVLSEVNFRRLVKERQVAAVDLVAIKLREGADLRQAQARLQALLPGDVMVMTQAELRAHERRYWEEATPIGFIFAFGSAMGLVVGMVIVYQILFSDIAGHLKEYATLKAMGYSGSYLARVVLGAALILAVAGFIPGLLLSFVMYDFVGSATFLPLRLDAAMGITVFVMIFVMCAVAGLLAVRKLRDANPADMF